MFSTGRQNTKIKVDCNCAQKKIHLSEKKWNIKNVYISWRNPIKWLFILFYLEEIVDVIHSNFWTSWWTPIKWPIILFVLKSRKDYMVLFILTFVPTDKTLWSHHSFICLSWKAELIGVIHSNLWTSWWNPIKWPAILFIVINQHDWSFYSFWTTWRNSKNMTI